MRTRVAAALLAVGLVAVGCSEPGKPVIAPPISPSVSEAPVYDPSLEPAAAAIALVPSDATALAVTDFGQARLQLGFDDLTSTSPPQARARFAALAAKKTALLGTGLLQPVDARLRADFAFGQDDVDWQAQFVGPDGSGWVIKLRDDLPDAGVERAVAQGVGLLAGSTYYSSTRVILKGATTDPTASWRADPAMTALVGQVATSTYVSSTCLPFDVAFGSGLKEQLAPAPATDVDSLEALGPFSVTFGTSLVTARLGARRGDVFDRADLAAELPATDPDFGLGFRDAVGDPLGGRIGYTMGDAATAARLTLAQHLPFAVCNDG